MPSTPERIRSRGLSSPRDSTPSRCACSTPPCTRIQIFISSHQLSLTTFFRRLLTKRGKSALFSGQRPLALVVSFSKSFLEILLRQHCILRLHATHPPVVDPPPLICLSLDHIDIHSEHRSRGLLIPIGRSLEKIGHDASVGLLRSSHSPEARWLRLLFKALVLGIGACPLYRSSLLWRPIESRERFQRPTFLEPRGAYGSPLVHYSETFLRDLAVCGDTEGICRLQRFQR